MWPSENFHSFDEKTYRKVPYVELSDSSLFGLYVGVVGSSFDRYISIHTTLYGRKLIKRWLIAPNPLKTRSFCFGYAQHCRMANINVECGFDSRRLHHYFIYSSAYPPYSFSILFWVIRHLL